MMPTKTYGLDSLKSFLENIEKTEKFFISEKKEGKWIDYYVEKSDDIGGILEQIDFEKSDVYFSVFNFNGGKRREENVILENDLFVFDIDKKNHEIFTDDEIDALVNALKKYAYYIIFSGRGLQFAIKTTSMLETEKKELMKEFYRKLGIYFNYIVKNVVRDAEIDFNALKLTQVVRAPFTINQKSKRVARVLYFNEENMMSVDELKEIIRKVSYEKEEEKKKNVVNVSDNFINEIAFTVASFYRKGRRHNVVLGLSALLRKKTDLNEEEVKKIVEKIVEITHDEERTDRIRAVEDTFKKNIEEIAYSTYLTEEEIRKILSVIEKYSVVRNKYIYALERSANVKTFIELDYKNKETRILKIKNTEDGDVFVAEKTVILAVFNVKKKKTIIARDSVETRYDVVVSTKNFVKELKNVNTDEIIEFIQKNGLDVARKDVLRKTLNVILNSSTKVETIYKNYSIQFTIDQINKISRVLDEGVTVSRETLNRALKYIKNISNSSVAVLLLSHVVVSVLREYENVKLITPIINLVGEKGLGKSTLAEFFTRTAFLNEIETQDTLNSVFRFVTAFSRDYTPILLDDVSKFTGDLFFIIKSYATSNSIKIKRGRSNLTIEEYELTNSMILTSNEFFFNDDALRDRFIVIEIKEPTFKTKESAMRCNFDLEVRGWGFVLAHEFTKVFDKKLFEELKYKKMIELETKIENETIRRLELIAQYLTIAEMLKEVINIEYDEEELIELLISKTTEDEVQTAIEIISYALSEGYVTMKDSKIYLTTTDFQKIKNDLRLKMSYRELARALNKKIKQITIEKTRIRAIDVTEFTDNDLIDFDNDVVTI